MTAKRTGKQWDKPTQLRYRRGRRAPETKVHKERRAEEDRKRARERVDYDPENEEDILSEID